MILMTCRYSSLISQLVFNNDPNWELIFEDNFNTIDTMKWVVHDDCEPWERGDTFWTYRNHPNNVFISNGTLNLRVTETWHKNRPFASGYIRSKASFTRGCFYELRTRFNETPPSMWPTFWMWRGFTTDSRTPCDYQEIDFFDNTLWPKNNPSAPSNTVIDYWCKTNFSDSVISYHKSVQFNNIVGYNRNNFNTHQSAWFGTRILHYINDREFSSNPNFPFAISEPMRITIRLQNGVTSNRNDIKSNAQYNEEYNKIKLASNTNYTFSLDYLRIWRLRKGCTQIINNIPNWNAHVWNLKRRYNLSGATVFLTGVNRYFYSLEGYDLNAGLIIPNNTHVDFHVIPDCNF